MQTKRTVYVAPDEVREQVPKRSWPHWLTRDLRTDVLVDLLYERPQGGYCVELPGVARFVVQRARRKPPTDSSARRRCPTCGERTYHLDDCPELEHSGNAEV